MSRDLQIIEALDATISKSDGTWEIHGPGFIVSNVDLEDGLQEALDAGIERERKELEAAKRAVEEATDRLGRLLDLHYSERGES